MAKNGQTVSQKKPKVAQEATIAHPSVITEWMSVSANQLWDQGMSAEVSILFQIYYCERTFLYAGRHPCSKSCNLPYTVWGLYLNFKKTKITCCKPFVVGRIYMDRGFFVFKDQRQWLETSKRRQNLGLKVLLMAQVTQGGTGSNNSTPFGHKQVELPTSTMTLSRATDGTDKHTLEGVGQGICKAILKINFARKLPMKVDENGNLLPLLINSSVCGKLLFFENWDAQPQIPDLIPNLVLQSTFIAHEFYDLPRSTTAVRSGKPECIIQSAMPF